MRKYGRYEMKIVLGWKNPQKIPSFLKITKEGYMSSRLNWGNMINAAKKIAGEENKTLKQGHD